MEVKLTVFYGYCFLLTVFSLPNIQKKNSEKERIVAETEEIRFTVQFQAIWLQMIQKFLFRVGQVLALFQIAPRKKTCIIKWQTTWMGKQKTLQCPECEQFYSSRRFPAHRCQPWKREFQISGKQGNRTIWECQMCHAKGRSMTNHQCKRNEDKIKSQEKKKPSSRHEKRTTGTYQSYIQIEVNSDSQGLQSEQELQKIRKENQQISNYIKNITRMALVRHFGFWSYNAWKFRRNKPIHRTLVQRFIKKTWPLSENHWQRVATLLSCYCFQRQNGQIILKKPSNLLFARWWKEVNDHLKPKFLNIWMRKARIGLERRKQVCPQVRRLNSSLRKFRERMKKGSQRVRQVSKINAYNRMEMIERRNHQFKYQQIFTTMPPKTHAKEYHQMRQEYVNNSMYEKILDTLSASSVFKRYLFLQRGGIQPQSSKWGLPTFNKDYLFIPHFIVDEQEREINQMVQKIRSDRLGQTRQGPETYTSDPQYWMVKGWRQEIKKTGIIFTDQRLEEAYSNSFFKHLLQVELVQLKKQFEAPKLVEQKMEQHLFQLQLAQLKKESEAPKQVEQKMEQHFFQLEQAQVKKEFEAPKLVGQKIEQQLEQQNPIKKAFSFLICLSLEDVSAYLKKLIESFEIEKQINRERDSQAIRNALLNRDRRIQAQQSIPRLGMPKKIRQNLQQTPQTLPENWKEALQPVRHKGQESYGQYNVCICSRCNKHLLEVQGEIWECSQCQGLFHNKCWHQLGCNLMKKSWADSFYPLDHPPAINLTNYRKNKTKILKIKRYKKGQRDLVEKINKKNDQIIRQRGIPTRKNIYYRGYQFYPCMNEDLQIIADYDWEVLQKWRRNEYHSPVSIQQMGQNKGKGVCACMEMEKDEFICQYVGDVYPRSFWKSQKEKEYIFQLSYGPKSSKQFEICPRKHWSIANYLNHSPKTKANVVSVAFLTEEGVAIILRTKKKVGMGVELTYCYNGREENYETKGFE